MKKGEEFGKYKESSSRIWEKDEYTSEKTRKFRYSREKRFQEGRVTSEIYSENIVWVGQQKVWEQVFKEVGKKLEMVKGKK